MRIFLIALLSLFAAPVFADVSAAAGSSSTSQSAAVSGANSGGNTVNGGYTDLSTNPATTLNINAAQPLAETIQRIENSDYTIKNVPGIAMGVNYPTAPCMGSSQVGGAGVGFGVSIGTTWESKECQLRETARSFSALQLNADALAILCTSDYAVAAPSCGKRTKE